MSNVQKPLVTAVIPTRNRPDLVRRALDSVLNQTFPNLECIVVIDGPDSKTAVSLQKIVDPRFRVIELQENVGGCEARNLGVRAAHGEWIALLDDDDEWLPYRLERQLATLDDYGIQLDMVASRFLDRGPVEEVIRPTRFPVPGEHISDFLWGNVSPLGGIIGFPQTSTWLVRRSVLLATPFTKNLKALQDLDWLLHAYHDKRMAVAFVEQPLTIFHNEHARSRVTKAIDWHFCYAWAMENRPLFTRRAFAAFLVVYCVNPAAQQREPWRTRLSLLRDSFRFGRMTTRLFVLFLLYNSLYPILGRLLSKRAKAVLLMRFKHLLRTVWQPSKRRSSMEQT